MTTAVEERTNTVERYLPEGTELLMQADLAVLPPSVNHTYSSNWRGSYYKKTEVKNWQEAVACIFANKYGSPLPYDGVVGFYIIIKTRTRRNMDIDNRIKSVQDCLSMGRVIKNDSQIWDLRVIRILDKSLKEDCAEVMLFAIPESGSGVYIHNGDRPAWIQ